ncbi:Diaminopimelate decarboxylase protein, related [Neospora caninum Liverpool]|uniref:Diaminopimelate decarboxylase protein, related n=1 Tax=Neospora caninum (strain Liverpool) TaxID=572307 RepID=F0VRF3_NEOCL|nr:Diaminopimelate decarboxylase protein, related [Neospora caninum Liverpool]CBZ56301.1 Diaminopimelate decarboxylase protein, related [Neospora caninum Liverpool]CEL71063.1 TPA: Diaminopimelate decarboxylase protein, related [Neospora caninum Liverpool]|eukprot:XP_003886326.1 Diaminopimelate decarboxylase protein, related [Neospora caninum Liverpool]
MASFFRQQATLHQTPFYLYDEARIRENCRRLLAAFSWASEPFSTSQSALENVPRSPREALENRLGVRAASPSGAFTNYFAVKATPTPAILEILREEGLGADCSSLAELLLAEAAGFRGERIFFTSNDTPLEEFLKARDLGAIINLDDASHLDFLHEKLGGALPSILCFRFNPSAESRQATVQSNPMIMGRPEESKFGMTKTQLFRCISRARAWGVCRFALHAMILSNSLSVDEVVETARLLLTVAAEIKERLGTTIEMINLGGGFGVPYRPEEKDLDLHEVSARIRTWYKCTLALQGLAGTRIVTENGRLITADAGVLVTRVIHQKKTYKRFVGVDACMAHLMRPGMYGAYHHISVVPDRDRHDPRLPSRRNLFFSPDDEDEEAGVSDDAIYDVVGGLCENNDKFAVDRPLPRVDIGDLLLIHDVGAHGHSMCFNYNGRLRCAEYLRRLNGEVVMIRRAETLNDLFATIQEPSLPCGLSLLFATNHYEASTCAVSLPTLPHCFFWRLASSLSSSWWTRRLTSQASSPSAVLLWRRSCFVAILAGAAALATFSCLFSLRIARRR